MPCTAAASQPGLSGQPGAQAPTEPGDPRVEDALSRLAEVDALPLADQVEVFNDVHRRLRRGPGRSGQPGLSVARRRLDAELVRRGLARSREQAQQLIADGRVRVAGATATKAATQVEESAAVLVAEAPEGPDYVSRGAHKLVGALAAFDPDVGSSPGAVPWTRAPRPGGSPTSCCAGARPHVLAVDVGYGQLAWSLQTDERVTVIDRTNLRAPRPSRTCRTAPDLVVGDLSFISLAPCWPASWPLTSRTARTWCSWSSRSSRSVATASGSGGVVRDPELRSHAVL